MRLRALAIALILFCAPCTAGAASENFIDTYVPDAQIAGKGRYTYLLFNVYDAVLYAPKGQWNNTKPYALSLHYLRNLKGSSIADRSAQEIRKQGFNDEVRLAAWHTRMTRIFPDVNRQTILTGIYIPEQETRFYDGSAFIGSVKDPDFGKWFFGIWLSERTSEPDFRKLLIGY